MGSGYAQKSLTRRRAHEAAREEELFARGWGRRSSCFARYVREGAIKSRDGLAV